jgi:hypothetical protein
MFTTVWYHLAFASLEVNQHIILKSATTLEVLDLQSGVAGLAAMVIKSRRQALVDMLKINMSIQTVRLDRSLTSTEFYRESILPYLKTSRRRPRVRAIQRTRPMTYRAKVLGRALLAARVDANSFWMLLSGNSEVAFPSTAANLPTPTTAATSNAAAVAATTSVTVTATRTASTISASTTANVAAPTADRKRSMQLGDTQSD